MKLIRHQYVLLFLVFVGCQNNQELTHNAETHGVLGKYRFNVENLEDEFGTLAYLLPEALLDTSLARIVYESASYNYREDEAFALWSEVVDVKSDSKTTIRQKLLDIIKFRNENNGIYINPSLLDSLDETDFLQVYIHSFENWNYSESIGAIAIPISTPDSLVTALKVYDSSGTFTEVPVDTVGPTEPIAVVGVNEGMAYDSETSYMTDPGGATGLAGYYPRIRKIKLTRNPTHYEPWYAGKAEVYWVAPYLISTSNGSMDLCVSQDKWNIKVWNLTWTGFHSVHNWKTIDYRIKPLDDAEYPNTVQELYFYEYDFPFIDGMYDEPLINLWSSEDCVELSEWPLVGWLFGFLCDTFGNILQLDDNDDYIGIVDDIYLLQTYQTFIGDGVDLEIKTEYYDEQ